MNDNHGAEDAQELPDSNNSGPPTDGFCTSFTCTLLSKRQTTRILLLEPGEPTDELRGIVKHVISLEDHDYEALSYAWGKPKETHSLKLAGEEKKITGSLDTALRALRYPNMLRALGVDQICINQKDVLERSRQVSAMQEIFANATQVLVWLREESHEDALTISSLRRASGLLAN